MSSKLVQVRRTDLAATGKSSRNVFAFSFTWFCTLLLCLGMAFAAAQAQANASESAAAVDLNRATLEQLEALPGIGEVKAAAILAIRDERGGFSSVAELESVRGIGPALVGKLRPLVTVGAKAKPASKKTARK